MLPACRLPLGLALPLLFGGVASGGLLADPGDGLGETLEELLDAGAGLGGDLGEVDAHLLDFLGGLGGGDLPECATGLPFGFQVGLVAQDEYGGLLATYLLDVLHPLADVRE